LPIRGNGKVEKSRAVFDPIFSGRYFSTYLLRASTYFVHFYEVMGGGDKIKKTKMQPLQKLDRFPTLILDRFQPFFARKKVGPKTPKMGRFPTPLYQGKSPGQKCPTSTPAAAVRDRPVRPACRPLPAAPCQPLADCQLANWPTG